MARRCCKMCRHYRSEVMGFGGEPLDTVAYCGTVRRVVESDDLCEGFSPSLWGAAVENESEVAG